MTAPETAQARCRGHSRFAVISERGHAGDLAGDLHPQQLVEQRGGRCAGVLLTGRRPASGAGRAGPPRSLVLADRAARCSVCKLRPGACRRGRCPTRGIACATVPAAAGSSGEASVDLSCPLHGAGVTGPPAVDPATARGLFTIDGPGGLRPGTAVRAHRDGSAVCGTVLRRCSRGCGGGSGPVRGVGPLPTGAPLPDPRRSAACVRGLGAPLGPGPRRPVSLPARSTAGSPAGR